MRIIQGDSLEVLRTFDADSIDAVVTDPPYGLSFMNKHWDYDVPSVELWREVLRVLKPGGHLLSFGGTRTYHRMVVAIEDAGFEIRDQLQWLFGSGFPKSMDVSKAIDKAAGAKREVVGVKSYPREGTTPVTRKATSIMGQGEGENVGQDSNFITAPATEDAKQWEGWGTALKPAHEGVCLARKPYSTADLLTDTVRSVCRSPLLVEVVEQTFQLKLAELGEGAPIAQWTVGNDMPTSVGLLVVTGMYLSASDLRTNSNIESSWLATLGEILRDMNTFTTEMQTSLTTDLKILKSCLCQNTLSDTPENRSTTSNADALTAGQLFSALGMKLRLTRELFVGENATSQVDVEVSRPDANEPIVLARKPLGEKTVARNVLRYGTGALNIDASRIGTTDTYNYARTGGSAIHSGGMNVEPTASSHVAGRWPSNVILACDCGDDEGQIPLLHRDGCAVGELDRQSGDRGLSKGGSRGGSRDQAFGMKAQDIPLGFGDTGGASRFFYVAKTSKRERNAGCEEMPAKEWKEQGFRDNETTHLSPRAGAGRTAASANHHPTVKPVKLMEYLIRMITPPGGSVLDPFTGSGSTGVAAKRLGFDFIGIEREADYVAIAQKRIDYA